MGAINRPLQLVGCICQHALTGSIIGTYEALVVYYRSPLIPASTLLAVRDDRSYTVPQGGISPAEDCRVGQVPPAKARGLATPLAGVASPLDDGPPAKDVPTLARCLALILMLAL